MKRMRFQGGPVNHTPGAAGNTCHVGTAGWIFFGRGGSGLISEGRLSQETPNRAHGFEERFREKNKHRHRSTSLMDAVDDVSFLNEL